jgi:hypothetical protein
MASDRDANKLPTIFCYTVAVSLSELADSAPGWPTPDEHGGYQILAPFTMGSSVQRFRALESAPTMPDMWPMTCQS